MHKVIIVLGLIGMVLSACSPAPPIGGGSGRIAFDSDRDGDIDIYLMDVDGSNVVRLTDDPADDHNPVWSPDGRQIAFLSGRDSEFGGSKLYLMDADGANLVRLTDGGEGRDVFPTWSPDGSRIAFQAEQHANSVIHVIDIENSDIYWLALTDSLDFAPAWSPDGNRIAFVSISSGYSDLYIANADGTDIVRLTDNRADEFAPAWSPDGSRIAYQAMTFDTEGGFYANPNIYIMDADGSNRLQLTDDGTSMMPSWSPDGTLIAFTSERDGDYDLYIMNDDGSNVVQLTNDPGSDMCPSWQP